MAVGISLADDDRRRQDQEEAEIGAKVDKQIRVQDALRRLFPTEGIEEVVSMEDSDFIELLSMVHEAWSEFPESLKKRIETIEHNMCKRQPFALHVIPFLADEDEI